MTESEQAFLTRMRQVHTVQIGYGHPVKNQMQTFVLNFQEIVKEIGWPVESLQRYLKERLKQTVVDGNGCMIGPTRPLPIHIQGAIIDFARELVYCNRCTRFDMMPSKRRLCQTCDQAKAFQIQQSKYDKLLKVDNQLDFNKDADLRCISPESQREICAKLVEEWKLPASTLHTKRVRQEERKKEECEEKVRQKRLK